MKERNCSGAIHKNVLEALSEAIWFPTGILEHFYCHQQNFDNKIEKQNRQNAEKRAGAENLGLW